MSLLKQKLQQQKNQDRGETVNDAALDLMEQMIGKKVAGENRAIVANGLTVAGDGTLKFKGFTLTAVGLVDTEAVSFEDWKALGMMLLALEGSIQWLIGDWILQGEYRHGQTYSDMMALTGREYDTLKDYVYVARNVQMSVRTDKLSFGHHKLLAAENDPDKQRGWLDRAIHGGWSVAELRKQMRGNQLGDASVLSKDVQQVLKRVMKYGSAELENPTREMLEDVEASIETLAAIRDEIIRRFQ